MPGSFRRYAVDFDGDGRRDLRGSPADAIGSVANFLVQHGWKPGEPVAATAALDVARRTRARRRRRRDHAHRGGTAHRRRRLRPGDRPTRRPRVLIELDSTDAESVFWVGFDNFYVVTRYNRSSFYAASVLELAQAIRAARAKPGSAAQ